MPQYHAIITTFLFSVLAVTTSTTYFPQSAWQPIFFPLLITIRLGNEWI